MTQEEVLKKLPNGPSIPFEVLSRIGEFLSSHPMQASAKVLVQEINQEIARQLPQEE